MPYRIALLSKFPPIEGGIAAKTFWLARGLAKRGHEVHVITNGISAGGEYRIKAGEKIPQDIPNLLVHRPPDDVPWHIPEDNEKTLSLLEHTVNVVRKYDIQILDTGFLVPYGIIGNLVKLSTGVHHVMRHGGSDIEKFLKRRIWGNVLNDAIRQADTIITEKRHEALFMSLSQRVVIQPAYVPDEAEFKLKSGLNPQKRLAFIGKINYHWQHKRLDDIASIMNQLSDQFKCLLVGQGNGMNDFQDNIGAHVVSKFKWLPFVPPWEMPQLLKQLDAIFVFESNLPHPIVSNLVLEATSSGVGIIADRLGITETYRDIMTLDENHVLVVSPTEASSSAEIITQWVEERARSKQIPYKLVSYQDYLSSTEKIYHEVLNNDTI